MLFAVPTSAHDLKILRPFVDILKFFGGLHLHSFVFFPASSVAHETAEIAAELNGLCTSLAVDALVREPSGGWPDGCSEHFRDVVNMIDARGDGEKPFTWMELDCLPIRHGWADRWEMEYNRRGMKFMGPIRSRSDGLRDKDGNPTGDGKYMVGTGVYPAGFSTFSTLYRYVQKGVPFDIAIGYEVAPHCWNTDLMELRNRTGNYRLNADGKIECDEIKPLPTYPSHAGVIGDMAFLVHGCQDDTLAKLVLSGNQPVVAERQERVLEMPGGGETRIITASTMTSQPTREELIRSNILLTEEVSELQRLLAGKPPRADLVKSGEGIADASLAAENSHLEGIIERLRAENAELKAMLAKMEQTNQPGGAGANPAEFAGSRSVKEHPESPGAEEQNPVPLEVEAIRVIVTTKKILLPHLAKSIKMDKDVLRRIIESPGSGLKINPRGLPWVSIAA